MYHDKNSVGLCVFCGPKNMDAAKDIQKEMLPIWAYNIQNMEKV
jgi:hypothetical protein